MKIYKKVIFCAAHQLKGHSKCGTLHGHNYVAEVWLEGDQKGKWDFVLDYHQIKNYFNQFDHAGLLEKSAEQMAKEAVKHFKKYDNIVKARVRIWETPDSYAEDEN